jgi:hypothetical protein
MGQTQPNPQPERPDPMKITISHHNEETICDFCGSPLYLGDPAIFHNLEYFCSSTCAKNHDCHAELNQIGIAYLFSADRNADDLADAAVIARAKLAE